MKLTKTIFYSLIVMALLITSVGVAFAEDGIIFRRNISKTPDNETEKANIYMMDFYVPAQHADGTIPEEGLDYYADPGLDQLQLGGEPPEGLEPVFTRFYAKPLITVWIDNQEAVDHELLGVEGLSTAMGGMSFGKFDAFVGVSTDDGATWKSTNISRSANLSSFTPTAAGVNQGIPYPGDVHNVVHQVFGDNILMVWVSKYCDGGTPLYTLEPDPNEDDNDVTYFEALEALGKDAVYLYDLFGVAGKQGSVDYTLQGFVDIGEIPYSCVWSARGKLIAGDDPTTGTDTEAIEELTHVIWSKPERLTSGTRDANLPAVDCAGGAGCVVTWQEDPEGLRPGQGLGPGEGWSGAIANAQTDIWYSYITAEDFNKILVENDEGDFVEIQDFETWLETYDAETSMPKPGVPMAMPVRLTDNAKCSAEPKIDNTTGDLLSPAPYCYLNFDDIASIDPLDLPTAPDENSTFCASTEDWYPPQNAVSTDPQVICVTEDNRLLNGRVASTRVRLNLKPYDSDGDLANDSAWVVLASEETKALGDILVGDTNGDGECQTEETECTPIDIGKDIWYYSFDPFEDHFMVDQGGILNQPAQCKYNAADDQLCQGLVEGDFYPVQTDERGYEFYLTEIARRFAVTTNSIQAAMDSTSKLTGLLIYKQGIINQGGPADIFLRRVVLPETFDPTVDNPYAYENMVCEEWAYDDGLNPNYLKGICLSPAINISGSTIVDCGGAGTDNDTCAAAFPVLDDGSNPDGEQQSFPKVYEWRQLPYEGTAEGGDVFTGDPNDESDLDDQSWENPYDVAKGHRGFLDGDIVMMMYAWAPNWNSNAVGNDHYNLYVRRSFDGGVTWTTTPADLEGLGTSYSEFYYAGTIGEPEEVVWTYGAGALEQARNVSMLTGNKITILDPRYTPSGGLKLYPTIRTDWLTNNGFEMTESLPYWDDELRAKDKFFIVYETGDNTTVAEGEAVPLDLFYSRATGYGDFYEEMLYEANGTEEEDDTYLAWPWLENAADDLSGEAGVVANPGATFMYAVWNQWQEEILPDGHELIYDSDIWFRRLMYNDTDVEWLPSASILYFSSDILIVQNDDVLTIIATAKDNDTLGEGDDIVTYEWSVDDKVYDGPLCNMNVCQIPARVLSNGWDGFGDSPDNVVGNGGDGWHVIKVRAMDNDGHWSYHVMKKAYVAQTEADVMPYTVNIPFITR